ncbi:O-antigen ligase family protein [Staphylococcus sp. HMSC061G12]|uniref:O-antigen ligase family protein n=1 Tax=Staphylococcus sp. HMSC061G12 TaxID=1739441 RepID=UPI0008A95E8F|nr:O-antigen ligase family protein [Staphylococcus sp. HMSC061G12]OHR60351.1 hypothetical protein HMPREF2937_06605 [Staphylococcus sp. HMSC061G12]
MKKTLFYINLFLIFLFQFISEVVSPIPTLVFAFLCITAFLLVNTSQLMGLYLYLIPLSSGAILYLVNILFLIFLIIHFRKEIQLNKAFILIFLIILIESAHVFINVNTGLDESIIKLLGFAACILLFGFIETFSKSIDVKGTFNLLIFGVMGFILITTGIYIFKYNISDFFNEIRRFGFVPHKREDEMAGLIINPNTVGKYCAFIITMVLSFNYFGKISFNIWYLGVLVSISIVGLLTLSRTFLLVLGLILIIYLFFSILDKKIFPIIMFGIILSIFIGVLIFNEGLMDSLYSRLFDSNDITGSRFTIYTQYLMILLSNGMILLFGVGMQNYMDKFSKIDYTITQSTHNVLLEVLSIWGIIGLIIVILLFAYIIFTSKLWLLNSKAKAIILLPFLVVIISAFFGQFFISYYHTFGITLFSLVILYDKEVVVNGQG